jgi:hypothetical protein
LIDYIRKNAPEAEILVHETWAYRQDHALFTDGTFSQQKMYDQLKVAYGKVAARYGLRFIPSGDAFQAARQLPRWSFVSVLLTAYLTDENGLRGKWNFHAVGVRSATRLAGHEGIWGSTSWR